MFKKISVFVLSAFIVGVSALEPDYIRTTVYNVDDSGSNLVSTVYSGFGREVQSKFKIDNEKDRVVATFYDKLNRKRFVTKPFIDTVFKGSYLPGDFGSINNFLKETYKSFDNLAGDPYAYSEIQYYSDQSGRVKVSGAPGVNNRIGSGNEKRSWFFGVSLDTLSISLPQGTVAFQNGLIKNLSVNSGFDKIALLDSLYGYLLLEDSSGFSSCNHFLTVTMEPLGNYSQKLDDELGRTVATWSDPDSTANNEILARTRYDFYGNPIEEIAPVNFMNSSDTVLIANSKYLYNTLGQVIRRETPDGIIDTISYNSNGQISLISSWTFTPESTKLHYETTYYAYDLFGRQISVWKIRGGESVARISNYYDNTDQLKTLKDYYNIPSGILDNLENINNKMVAAVAHNYIGSKVYIVVDLFSYNDEGEISKKFKIVPGLPLQEINYTYDIHGKIIDQKIICGRDTVIKHYSYDNYGRIRKITHNNNGKELVKYTYYSMGKTTVKTLDSIHDVQYLYTIQDQIKKIQSNGPSGFSEDIAYLPNGNIETLKSYYKGGVTDSIFNTYSYDNVNRLVAVNSNKSEYNSSYSYDQAGRFKSKEEGSTLLSDYTYYHKTNRLRFAKDTIRDYVYDQRGNLIVDRFKNMVILYNGDNQPVQFRFYKSIPAAVSADVRGTVVISDSTFSGNVYQYMDNISNNNIDYSLISTVTMLYDASGNRVLKMENIQ